MYNYECVLFTRNLWRDLESLVDVVEEGKLRTLIDLEMCTCASGFEMWRQKCPKWRRLAMSRSSAIQRPTQQVTRYLHSHSILAYRLLEAIIVLLGFRGASVLLTRREDVFFISHVLSQRQLLWKAGILVQTNLSSMHVFLHNCFEWTNPDL